MNDAPDWWAKREHRRAQAAKRRPPMPPGPHPAGQCQWCAQAILYPEGHKRAGEVNTRRGWHAECGGWFKLAAQGESQRWACWQRDKGTCGLCGVVMPETRVVGFKPYGTRDRHQISRVVSYARQTEGGLLFSAWRKDDIEYCPIEPVQRADWDADHIVPLWSLRDAGLEARGCHWGLVNLWTLCRACHTAKTKREAAARAALRSQERSA